MCLSLQIIGTNQQSNEYKMWYQIRHRPFRIDHIIQYSTHIDIMNMLKRRSADMFQHLKMIVRSNETLQFSKHISTEWRAEASVNWAIIHCMLSKWQVLFPGPDVLWIWHWWKRQGNLNIAFNHNTIHNVVYKIPSILFSSSCISDIFSILQCPQTLLPLHHLSF